MFEKSFYVPQAVLSAFAQRFGNIEGVEWELESVPPSYEASFEIDGLKKEAYFRADGKFLQLETQISVDELPEAVLEGFAEKYPNHGIIEAEKVELADGEVLYDIDAVRQFTVQFREDGVFTAEADEM